MVNTIDAAGYVAVMTAQEQAVDGKAEPARAPAQRGQLVLIGVMLIAAFACVLVAALPPSLRSVYTSPAGFGTVMTIAHHLTLWKVATSAFGIGIGIELVGLAALTARIPSTLPIAALGLFVLAATMWVINLVFRLTVTVSVATSAVGSGTQPPWYQDIRNFTDDGLLNAVAVAGGMAMILYGIAVGRSRVLGAWSGVLAAAFGALLVVLYFTGSVIPAVLYLAGLPLGVSALIRGVRAAAAYPQPSDP
jgi:hypothetical protein